MLYTSRISYRGTIEQLNISRMSGVGDGLAFAPSWKLLRAYLDCLKAHGDSEALWAEYRDAFLAEMNVSSGLVTKPDPLWGEKETRAAARGIGPQPDAWRRAIAKARDNGLAITCYCGKEASVKKHCHRFLVAELWEKMGVQYGGELPW